MAKPSITGTTHTLPFDKLSPLNFERLCLWLVEREGYVRAEHLGAAGSEQGRDVIAYSPTPEGDELWYFQCKRYRSIGAATLKREVDKYLQLAQNKPHLKPVGVVFVISCFVSAQIRETVGDYCEQHGLAYEFWAETELDEKVKRHNDIVQEFFQASEPSFIQRFLGLDPNERRTLRNRQAMLELVRNTWVKGVLEQSLHGAALIELGLEGKPGAVRHPWGMAGLQVLDQPNRSLPPGTNIIEVFDNTSGALLILGEPGSGKTTMLLELARNTIARAEGDPTLPIPVVFNLSSWAEKRQSIVEWLVEELNTKYHVPNPGSRTTICCCCLTGWTKSRWSIEKHVSRQSTTSGTSVGWCRWQFAAALRTMKHWPSSSSFKGRCSCSHLCHNRLTNIWIERVLSLQRHERFYSTTPCFRSWWRLP